MLMPDIVREQVILGPYTTLGLGGPASFFAAAHSEGDVCTCLQWARHQGLPVHVLGGGSNTVFADGGFPGLALHICLTGTRFTPDGDTVSVAAAAGELWSEFVDACVQRGLGGVECLAGIPGQVGATPIQNVGAYGQEVAETITSVRALERSSLEVMEIAAADCGFDYRGSRFKTTDRHRYVLLEVGYRLRPEARPTVTYPELQRHLADIPGSERREAGAPALTAVRDAVIALRRAKSMLVDRTDPESRSAGSFFLNPVLSDQAVQALKSRLKDPREIPVFAVSGGTKVPAAWLIERAGFARGYVRDGVGISTHHALSLVNRNGTTRALLSLAEDIRGAVAQRFGVVLEMEPVVAGG
jgi:UDP-N-acetylmuramate dehydrogenase